jgi:protein-S-isoprenylcysteine O-methyltransferase Ste14
MPETSRLLQVAALQLLIGALEGFNVLRQRRRGRSPAEDRDAASKTLLALTWWPPGLAALLAARLLPIWNIPRAHQGAAFRGGTLLAGVGVLIRQWSIATLGTYFVGEVIVQPEQQVISRGPYRWVRHPSYTGLWLEIVGIGLASGSVVGLVACALVPLIGILRRIHGEEQELRARLPGYREYARERRRLVPHVW